MQHMIHDTHSISFWISVVPINLGSAPRMRCVCSEIVSVS